ncbi:MAG: transposase [Deltaproteobacteria bacterium]|nr:transposase [Deltaproteobacteria bacterium]
MKHQNAQIDFKPKSRKHLNADALFKRLHIGFSKVSDCRQGDIDIAMADALMSGFAMFSLKDPSLLAFDKRRGTDENLRTIYHIESVPSDTQMRTILDGVNPEEIRPAYKDIFRALQRGKALEPMAFFEGCYLLSLDGTGYFSSKKLSSGSCLKKVSKKSGEVTYYQQMLGGAIVHPDFKEVIPLAPEFIIKQDGQSKNDCERNAAKRFFKKLRKDHPRLPLIIIEDALSSNAPHIREAEKYNLHYILGVKNGDHSFLFNQVKEAQKRGETTQFEFVDKDHPEMVHRFLFLNQVPLNESNQNLLVNFLEYWQITPTETKHFSWITDFTVTKDNAYQLMRGGRARWKIENETFNTLKNQGYHFGHNYGLGKNNLSAVFAMLMMLAFLVDQTQQICCSLFRTVWKKLGSKRELWERMRSLFKDFAFESMKMLYEALLYGIKFQPPIILYDTS